MVEKVESMDFGLNVAKLRAEDMSIKTENNIEDPEGTVSADYTAQETMPDPYTGINGEHSYLVQDIKMDIELESETPQPIPVVYTTRLDRMRFMYRPVTKDNQSLIIKSVIKESKPMLTSLNNTDQKLSYRKSKYNFTKLILKIKEFNKIVRESVPTPTKEVVKHDSRTAEVLLKNCKPFIIDLDEIPERRNDWVLFKLSRLHSIKDQITRYFEMSKHIVNKYFCLKNEHTEVTDIYLLKKNQQVSEYYRIDSNKHIPIQNAHKITITYCCWYDRELKLKLFFNRLELNVPKYFRKPHTCIGCCKCCCSHHSRISNISPQQEEYQQPNDKMKSQQNRISYLIDKSPSETANMSVINKALRFIPKISRKITPNLKAKDTTPPINIHLKDNKTKECSYYRIGEYGQLETYLKPYSPQWKTPFHISGEEVTNQDEANDPNKVTLPSEDVSQQEYNKNTDTEKQLDQTEITFDEILLCWFTRQNVLNKLLLEHVPENIIQFLKVPHDCSPGNCECCCKSPNNEHNKLHIMVNLPEVPIYTTRMYTISNISLQFNNILTIPIFRTTLKANKKSEIKNMLKPKIMKTQNFTGLKKKGKSNQSVKEMVKTENRDNYLFVDYVHLTDDKNPTNATTAGNSKLSGHALSSSYNLPSISHQTSPSLKVSSISLNKSITNNMNTANARSSEEVKIFENFIRLAQKEIDTLRLNTATPTQNSVDTTAELPILVQMPRSIAPNGTGMAMTSNKSKQKNVKNKNIPTDFDIDKSLYKNNGPLETKKMYELFTKMTYKNNTHCVRSYGRESNNMSKVRSKGITRVAADSRNLVDTTLTPVRTLNPTMKINTDERLGRVVLPKGGEIILTKDSRPQWKLPGNPNRIEPQIPTVRPLQEAANRKNKTSSINMESDLNKDYDLEEFLATTTIVKRKRSVDIEIDAKRPRKMAPKPFNNNPLAKVSMDPTSMKNGSLLVKTETDHKQPVDLQPVTTADAFNNPSFHMAYVPVLNIPNGPVVPNAIVPQIVANHNSIGQLSDAFRFDLPKAVDKKSSLLKELLAQPQREVTSVGIGPSKIRPKPLLSLLKSSGMPSEQSHIGTVIVDDESINSSRT